MKYNVGDRVITDTNMKGKIIEVLEEGWYCVEFEPYNGIPQPNGVVPEESMSLVEEEVDLIPKFGEYSDNEPLDVPTMTTDFVKEHGFPCPEGYIFKDENGNVINATKISLCKKKEVIPDLQLDSIRTVREYCTEHSRIWLEIYEDNPKVCVLTHLLVDEDHRQKGYGTKAIEQQRILDVIQYILRLRPILG